MRFGSLAPLLARVPFEVGLLALGLVVWAGGLLFGLPLLTTEVSVLMLSTYLVPFILAAAAQVFITALLWRVRPRGGERSPYLLAYSIPTLAAFVYLYYQFKSWAMLVNRTSFDAFYQGTDNLLAAVRDPIISARQLLDSVAPISLEPVYFYLFVAMFLVAFVACGILCSRRVQRGLLVGVCAMLLFGGISYWVAPAYGPFVYRQAPYSQIEAMQSRMLEVSARVAEIGATRDGDFGLSLGAMPSMHIGFAIYFLLFFRKHRRWVSWWYLFTLLWFSFDAVYLGWHYIVDYVGGGLVAWLCLWITGRLSSAEPSAGR